VPYIVYMPEKDRLLMLVSCDYPHRAMVLSSDDHGTTWSEPRPVTAGTPLGLGTSLTYLGQGEVLLHADNQRWFSQDYGVLWDSPVPCAPTSDGKAWYIWDPLFVERDEATGAMTRLAETGYSPDNQGYLRFSADAGRTWSAGVGVPQWKGINEVTILRAANGDWVAACRTELPQRFKNEIDHYEGLGVSVSKDRGSTWSKVNMLYQWGRHHPSLILMPNHDIVMTYVVRKGYVDTPDGLPQFGIEAVVSHDHGQTWDRDHRYILATWPGNRKDANKWWTSSQATSTVLLPDGSLLTAFGTGYRAQPGPNGDKPSPRDAGLIHWRLGDQPLDDARALHDAPFDSDARNIIDPATGSSKNTTSN
jgi:hypothetical protein